MIFKKHNFCLETHEHNLSTITTILYRKKKIKNNDLQLLINENN